MRGLNKLKKVVNYLRTIYYRQFISTNTYKGKCILNQPVIFNGQGNIELNNTTIGYDPSPGFYNNVSYIEARNINAHIRIGKSHINNNLKLVAQDNSINIGDNCLIGSEVEIINSDFHPISITNRHQGGGKSKEINIGDNVFIGSNVVILKGVSVGKNSVIANGSVVFDDVPENSIVRGNPATFYKKLEY